MKDVSAASVLTFRRFPWMLACAIAGTALSIALVHEEGKKDAWEPLLSPLLVCGLGMPLMFLLALLREQLGDKWSRWPIEVIGLGILIGYYFILPAHPSLWPFKHWIRFFLILAGLHFAAAVVPFPGRSGARAFWQFNRRLFLRFFLATLYASVLTAGLELALLSTSKLFDIHFEKTYFYLFIVMAGIFHPLFFLAGVPASLSALKQDESYPTGLKAFTQFALAPLVAVYVAILYAYAAKILIAMSWPRGWVALPVLILSGVGILAALLLHPLRAASNERWAVWYFRWFFRALAPLTILLLLSLRVRILEYGVTEERYLGVVAGMWILVVSGIYCLRPGAGIKWIPASLATICFLTAFGPWSAFDVSARSQLRRLDSALQKSGLWKEGMAAAAKMELSAADHDNLTSVIRYLIDHHGDAALRNRFASAAPMKQSKWAGESSYSKTSELMNWLQVSRGWKTDESFHATINENLGLPINGWRLAYPERYVSSGFQKTGNLELGIKDGKIMVSTGQMPKEELPIQPIIDLARKKPGQHSAEEMFIDWPAASPRFRIYLQEIQGKQTASGRTRIESCRVVVLER
jgi:hypothetical protein